MLNTFFLSSLQIKKEDYVGKRLIIDQKIVGCSYFFTNTYLHTRNHPSVPKHISTIKSRNVFNKKKFNGVEIGYSRGSLTDV